TKASSERDSMRRAAFGSTHTPRLMAAQQFWQLGDIRRHRSGVLTLRRDSFRRQLFLQKLSTELFHERAGRRQIGKTPSKIDLTFTNNPTSMTRLNFARPMKAHYAAAEFDIQFIIGDWDLDDVRIFGLVCGRLPDRWLEWSAHNDPTR